MRSTRAWRAGPGRARSSGRRLSLRPRQRFIVAFYRFVDEVGMEARTETDRRQTCSEVELEAALGALDRSPRLVMAGEWPADLGGLDSAGLYSWWVDREGAGDLARGLGDHLPAGRIYAGQAGATQWPSGSREPDRV